MATTLSTEELAAIAAADQVAQDEAATQISTATASGGGAGSTAGADAEEPAAAAVEVDGSVTDSSRHLVEEEEEEEDEDGEAVLNPEDIASVIELNEGDAPPPDDDDDDDGDGDGDGEGNGGGGGAAGEDGDEGPPPEDISTAKFTSHAGPVFEVAISSERRLVASGGEDDLAYLWSLETGELVHKLEGHDDSIVDVAFNKSGAMVATGSMDGVIKVWKIEDGSEVVELDCGDDLQWLAWHPVANFVLAATESGSIHMWDVPGANMSFFTGHAAAVVCGGWSPDGRNFVTGSTDASVILWSPKTGAVINKLDVKKCHNFHTAPLNCLGWHPDGGIIATGDVTGKLCVSHPKNGKVLMSVPTGETSIESVAVNGGKGLPTLVAAGTLDGKINVYDLISMRLIKHFGHDQGVVRLQWTGVKSITACSLDATVRVWNVDTGDASVLTGHEGHVLSFRVTKDASRAVSCGEDGVCRVFSL